MRKGVATAVPPPQVEAPPRRGVRAQPYALRRWPALILVMSVVGVCAPCMLLGHTTTYCPLRHSFSDTASCYLLDVDEDRALIQHADLDTSIAYLEISDPSGSTFFHLPPDIQQLAPAGYEATLIADNRSVVLISGERHQIHALAERPRW